MLALATAAFAVFEVLKYGGWAWLGLAAGLIGPDLTFLAGIGAEREEHGRGKLPTRVVPAYNLAHRPLLPIVFLTVVSLLPISHSRFVPWFVLGLAWLLHLAADRALGYGLRDADGWIRGRRPTDPVGTRLNEPGTPSAAASRADPSARAPGSGSR